MNDSERATVLIVDDDPDVVRTYQRYLEDRFDVKVGYDGEDALEVLDADGVDVVLLDRMMPGLSGGEVLERIRERGYRCRVAMVTAVDPDFDIVDMGFDDYVTKPSSRAELVSTVEKLLELDQYAERIGRYYSLLSKQAALRAEKSGTELEASEQFSELQSEIERVESELGEDTETLLEDAAFVAAIRSLDSAPGFDHREEFDG